MFKEELTVLIIITIIISCILISIIYIEKKETNQYKKMMDIIDSEPKETNPLHDPIKKEITINKETISKPTENKNNPNDESVKLYLQGKLIGLW